MSSAKEKLMSSEPPSDCGIENRKEVLGHDSDEDDLMLSEKNQVKKKEQCTSDRKRKDKIKQAIHYIGELLPLKYHTPGQKESSLHILESTKEYVQEIVAKNDKLLMENVTDIIADELKELKEQIKKLENENSRLSSLQKSNIDNSKPVLIDTNEDSQKAGANPVTANQQPADSSVDIAEPENSVQKKRKLMTVGEHLAAKDHSDQTPDSQMQDGSDMFNQQPLILPQGVTLQSVISSNMQHIQAPLFTQMAPVNLENSYSTNLTTQNTNGHVLDDQHQSTGQVVVQSNGQIFFVNDGNQQQHQSVENNEQSTHLQDGISIPHKTTTSQTSTVNTTSHQIVSVPNQGNNIPQALLLPNGTVVPVVSHPQTLLLNQQQNMLKQSHIQLQGQRNNKDPHAMITSTGTLVLTLPPGSQPVLDQNGLPLLQGMLPTTPNGQVIIRKQTSVPTKKGQRVIMPKPSVVSSSNCLSSQNNLVINGNYLQQQILQNGTILSPNIGQMLQQHGIVTSFVQTSNVLTTNTTQSTTTPLVTAASVDNNKKSDSVKSVSTLKKTKPKKKIGKIDNDSDDILAKAAEHIFNSSTEMNLSSPTRKEDIVTEISDDCDGGADDIDYLDMPCLSIVTDIDPIVSRKEDEPKEQPKTPSPKKTVPVHKKPLSPIAQKTSVANTKDDNKKSFSSPTISKKPARKNALKFSEQEQHKNDIDSLPDSIEFATNDLPSVLDRIESLNSLTPVKTVSQTPILSPSSLISLPPSLNNCNNNNTPDRKSNKRSTPLESPPIAKKTKLDNAQKIKGGAVTGTTSSVKQRNNSTSSNKKTPRKAALKGSSSNDPYTFLDEEDEVPTKKPKETVPTKKPKEAVPIIDKPPPTPKADKKSKEKKVSTPKSKQVETNNTTIPLTPTIDKTKEKTEKTKNVSLPVTNNDNQQISETVVTPKPNDNSTNTETTPEDASSKKHKDKHKKKKKKEKKHKEHKHKHKNKDKDKEKSEKSKDQPKGSTQPVSSSDKVVNPSPMITTVATNITTTTSNKTSTDNNFNMTQTIISEKEQNNSLTSSIFDSFNGPIPNLGTPMPSKGNEEPTRQYGLDLLNDMPNQTDGLGLSDTFSVADTQRRHHLQNQIQTHNQQQQLPNIVPHQQNMQQDFYPLSHVNPMSYHQHLPPVSINQNSNTKKGSTVSGNVPSSLSPTKTTTKQTSSKPIQNINQNRSACSGSASQNVTNSKSSNSSKKPSSSSIATSESGSAMRLTHMETGTSSSKQKQAPPPNTPFLPQHYSRQYLPQRGWGHESMIAAPPPFTFSLTSPSATITNNNTVTQSNFLGTQSCSKGRSLQTMPQSHRPGPSTRDPYGFGFLDPYENFAQSGNSRRHGNGSNNSKNSKNNNLTNEHHHHVDTNLGNSIFDQAGLLPPSAHAHSFMSWPSCGLEGTPSGQQGQQLQNQNQDQATAWATHNMNMFAWQQMTHPSSSGHHMTDRMAPAFSNPFGIPPHAGHFPPPHSLS